MTTEAACIFRPVPPAWIWLSSTACPSTEEKASTSSCCGWRDAPGERPEEVRPQSVADRREDLAEVGEDDHLQPVVPGLADQFAQPLQFGGRRGRGVGGPAHPHEPPGGDRLAVDLPVLGPELLPLVDLDQRREFGQHVHLVAAQIGGGDGAAEGP
ncbi:hypothetical protein SBADM41S_07170 [Streptomyces badius]